MQFIYLLNVIALADFETNFYQKLKKMNIFHYNLIIYYNILRPLPRRRVPPVPVSVNAA